MFTRYVALLVLVVGTCAHNRPALIRRSGQQGEDVELANLAGVGHPETRVSLLEKSSDGTETSSATTRAGLHGQKGKSQNKQHDHVAVSISSNGSTISDDTGVDRAQLLEVGAHMSELDEAVDSHHVAAEAGMEGHGESAVFWRRRRSRRRRTPAPTPKPTAAPTPRPNSRTDCCANASSNTSTNTSANDNDDHY